MVPITVIGAKYDLFAAETEPVKKKLLCSALRYIAHKNGCDLVFSSIKEQNPLKQFKNMMAWHTFRTLAEQMQIPNPDRDPLHAVSICAGTDASSKIGEPQGAGSRNNMTVEGLWQEAVEKDFKKFPVEEASGGVLPHMTKYAEEKVDKMRIQKDQELEDYKREIERAKRFEKSKLLS